MAVTLDDVRRVAALARIGLGDERASALVAELNTILRHMDALAQIDVSAVDDARSGAVEAAPLRPDAGPSIPLEHPRETFAPSMRDGFFLVPRLATHETAGDE